MAIQNTQIHSTPTQIFLAVNQQAITTIIACNVSQQTSYLSLFAVPYGKNPGVSTQILSEVELPAGESFALDSERFVLENNDAIYAQSSVDNAITITISSVSTA